MRDLELIQSVYMDENSESPLSLAERKALFTNLPAIISTSRKLKADLRENSIGLVFLDNYLGIQRVYSEYCRNTDHALGKLNEFSSPDCPKAITEYLQVHSQ